MDTADLADMASRERGPIVRVSSGPRSSDLLYVDVYTYINEYLKTVEEGSETPTAPSGRGQHKARQLAPFYDVWRYF